MSIGPSSSIFIQAYQDHAGFPDRSGQSSWFMQEDYNAIAKHLSSAQKPVSAAAQLRMQQENYFAQQQLDRQHVLHEQ